MNALHSASVASPETSDLDGYSFPGDYNYSMHSHYDHGAEEFGFDPPKELAYTKNESFSPVALTDLLHSSEWSGFGAATRKDGMRPNRISIPPDHRSQSFDVNQMLSQTIPDSSSTIARYGQVTPPRSNSATSDDKRLTDFDTSKTSTAERRKRSSKVSTTKEESEISQTTIAVAATTGRKRKTTRKSSTEKDEHDDKRKQSLEKNRVAAAKCRINKKEKTEQLQRHSHEKAVHNAFLKEEVMRMKEEVQQMNALLLAHANCEGCKSPEDIQKHLANLGNEFFAQHMSSMSYEYPSVNLDEMSQMDQDSTMQSDYFGSVSGHSGVLNPPLPDFDRAAEFEVHTPMHTD